MFGLDSIITAGASIFNGIAQRNAAKKAAEEAAKARELAAGKVNAATQQGMLGVTNAGDVAASGVLGAGQTAAGGVTAAGNAGRDRILEGIGAFDPYANAGAAASQQFTNSTANPAAQFNYASSTLGMDPGYLFRKKEAEKSMLANGAAFGDLQSGGFAKAFSDRASQEASQEVGNQYNRQLSTFNANTASSNTRLNQILQAMGLGKSAADSGLGALGDASRLEYQGAHDAGAFGTGAAGQAGMFGTSAAGTAAQLGLSGATTEGNLLTGAGDSRAVGTINAGNATTGMLGNLVNGIDWASILKGNAAKTAGPAYPQGGG